MLLPPGDRQEGRARLPAARAPMTHQVGRAEAGIREEMPLPLDKAAGPPDLPDGVCMWGFVSRSPSTPA